MLPVNIDQVREEADRVIALEPDDVEFNDICTGEEGWHSQMCENMMDHLSVPCINVQVEAARQRMRKLAMLSLLRDCARHPFNANGLKTFDGMAQQSCIFNVE